MKIQKKLNLSKIANLIGKVKTIIIIPSKILAILLNKTLFHVKFFNYNWVNSKSLTIFMNIFLFMKLYLNEVAISVKF